MSNTLSKRYEFVFLFDVENGNPNGDPDGNNMPRIDPETGHGVVTDVCLKRKIRNFVELTKQNEAGYRIFVREGAILNRLQEEAYRLHGGIPDKKLKKETETIERCKAFMCEQFYDIRTFGAVMTTEVNCGQVRGPVQLGFARSIDPILQQEVSITRLAVTHERDAKKERTMGRKHIVPYGMYRLEGFISSFLAEKTSFNSQDLDLFWEALLYMFDHDRSAGRGKMTARKLIIFEHDSPLGNAPAHKLFERVKIHKKHLDKPIRSFQEYEIEINIDNLPKGIQVMERE